MTNTPFSTPSEVELTLLHGDLSDQVVDSCVVALSEYTTEQLEAVAARAEEINSEGWLPKMIREYVDTWRRS